MFVLVWSCLKVYGCGRVLRYGTRPSSVVDLRSVFLILSTLVFDYWIGKKRVQSIMKYRVL
jgi:hypothetical protein